jgi:putative tryptophan/tyrosine transport system substrate-binding protein
VRRRDLLMLVVGLTAAAPLSGAAQPLGLPTIGVLLHGSERVIPQVLTEALRELGYIDGQNVQLEFRSAEGNSQRLPGLAAELVSRKVDLLVATSTEPVMAAKQATAEIPIVMVYVGDPVGMGMVASLAHPGGNVTGLSSLALDSTGKQVEFLIEAVPAAKRFAALSEAGSYANPFLGQLASTAEARGIAIEQFIIATTAEFEAAFPQIAAKQIDGLIIQGALSSEHAAKLALEYRLPAVSQHPFFARQGGLMGYFSSSADNARRAAVFIDKILKGAKPADLPVERPTRFELVINLKTARALGLTVPLSILVRADEVIE